MSKKNKPQKNLSLRERLEKHWNNKNWGAFVSLFMRDKIASLATVMGKNFCKGLYELMTESLFLNRNFDAAKSAALLILEEPDGSDETSEIKCCAQIASSFLKAREGEKFLLHETSQKIPPAYNALNEGLCDAMQGKSDSSLAKKFARQMMEAEGKGRLTPYTNWLKIAQELENTADGESAPVLRAVSGVVALIRELNRAERGKGHAMRKIDNVREFNAFDDVLESKDHPIVLGLWEVFCRAGESKFGVDWGKSARVIIRSEKYEHLLKADNWADVLKRAIKSGGLAEQERYLIETLYIKSLSSEFFPHFSSSEMKLLKTSLEDLARIGKRWRSNFVWSTLLDAIICELISTSDPDLLDEMVNMMEDIRLPYESLSPMTIAILTVLRGGNVADIEKSVRARVPMKLGRKEIGSMVSVIAEYSCLVDHIPLKVILGLERLFEKKTVEMLFTQLILNIAIDATCTAMNEEALDEQPWWLFKPNTLEKLGKLLPPDSPEGCFCRLLVPPYSISKSPELTEAFFNALQFAPEFGVMMFFFILAWDKVETDFIIRLFDDCRKFHQDAALKLPIHWEKIVNSLEKIKDIGRRTLIAHGVLNTMSKFKNKSIGLKKAILRLERIVKYKT